MCLLYTLSKELSNVCSHIFRENQKKFRSYPQYGGGAGRDHKQNLVAALQRKPARRDEKGDPQAGQRGRLFAASLSVAAYFFLCRPFGTEVLLCRLSGCVSDVLGVSLSAAARSAAALVYDKLTPNSHLCYNQYAL